MLFPSIESSNFREVDISIYTPLKLLLLPVFSLSNMFLCVKEMSQIDVSFTHTTYNLFL